MNKIIFYREHQVLEGLLAVLDQEDLRYTSLKFSILFFILFLPFFSFFQYLTRKMEKG